ncbi:hypothetical protein SNEBB_003844 [Seison nebaliae]|nr:hypothetical protein SNEBB_003844 [Seison nebaliae]
MNRWLVLVTGGSRGIGEAIVRKWYKASPDNSSIVLLARNGILMEKIIKDLETNEKRNIQIQSIIYDMKLLTDKLTARQILQKTSIELKNFSKIFFFLNHGTIELGKLSEINDNKRLADNYQININSLLFFVNGFRDWFTQQAHPNINRVHLINSSSLAAVKCFPLKGLYCIHKYGREALITTFALEEENEGWKYLNYAPGPVDTDMLHEIFRLQGKEGFRTILTPQQTIERLYGILEKDDYQTGNHIDYFD